MLGRVLHFFLEFLDLPTKLLCEHLEADLLFLLAFKFPPQCLIFLGQNFVFILQLLHCVRFLIHRGEMCLNLLFKPLLQPPDLDIFVFAVGLERHHTLAEFGDLVADAERHQFYRIDVGHSTHINLVAHVRRALALRHLDLLILVQSIKHLVSLLSDCLVVDVRKVISLRRLV